MSNLLLDTNGVSSYGLAPGGLGYSAWQKPAGISSDGGTGLKTTGAALLQQNIDSQECTFSFRYRCDVRGAGGNPIWTFFILAGSPGVWLRVLQKNTGKLSFTVQNGAAVSNSVDSTTVLATGTDYWLDGYVRADGTPWRMRLQIRNASNTILETMAEITLAGQVATVIPELRTGVDATSTATQAYHHCRVTDSWLDWPIGAHTSDDTETGTPISVYQPSWIDDPSQIPPGEIMTGVNAPYSPTYPAPNIRLILEAEGPTVANRHMNFFTFDYTPVTPPPNLYVERRLLNGTMFGDGISRAPIISGLGFDGFTPDWPANGLADFLSGAMDSTLQAWADLFDTQLPSSPDALFIWRPWREMNSRGTIYGPNGAAVTPHAGRNETDADFIAAWRYIRAFMLAHTAVARFRLAWCPQVGDGMGGLATTAALAQRYPGHGYTGWVMPTGYVSGPSRTVGQAFANAIAGWNETTGSIDHVPFGVSETQVDRTDSTRVADLLQYAPDFTTPLAGTRTVNFWRCIMTCQYPIIDQAGDNFVANFQALISSPPFLGEPVVTIEGAASATSATSASAIGIASGAAHYAVRPNGPQLWIEAA